MKVSPQQKKAEAQEKKTRELTRKIAVGLAFASVFFFFIKLLFL